MCLFEGMAMINEERVRQLYKVALCEQREDKVHRQIGRYYKSDYIGKEILKSIITGTVAYLFMSALWFICHWTEVMDQMNQLEFVAVLMPVVVIYLVYIVVYLIATYLVYKKRYERCYKQLEEYGEALQILDNMYEREEKLKS